MKMILCICAFTLTIALTGPQAFAISLGPAAEYNGFFFGDFTNTGNNTQGRLAAGGNVTLNSHSVGIGLSYDPSGATDTLIVGGNLSMPGWSTISNGNAVVGGTAELPPNYSPGQGTLSENADVSITWSTAEHYLTALSRDLASLATTGTAEYDGTTMYFSGDGTSDIQVFNVDGDAWSADPDYLFVNDTTNAPANATFIFNISGTTVAMHDTNMGSFLSALGESYDNVLFNFYEATALAISHIDVEGSILAPYASITASGGSINGTVIAQSFSGDFGLNSRPFESSSDPVTPVPEPGTLVLFSCGLLFLSGLMKRTTYRI